MTVLGANNGERLPAIDSQPAFENALRRALEMDEPLQGVLCNNLTVTGENLCRLEALQICLERCRFENCDFSKTSFYDARLVDCDFSNCAFSDSYWKRCQWIGCRLNGANFAGASLHDVQARDTRLRYANFARALMEDVKLTDQQALEIASQLLKDEYGCTDEAIAAADIRMQLIRRGEERLFRMRIFIGQTEWWDYFNIDVDAEGKITGLF